jgi:N-acetyl-anhydromuramyl-L-alanine amidase AmpD
MEFIQRILPTNCYGSNPAKHPDLVPSGIINHFISAIDAHKIGLDSSDPYDVDVCIEILKYYKISAHTLICRKGNVYQLVPFNKQAWHAGESLLNGRPRCNEWCLSIEHISTGKPSIDGDPAYPEPQILASIDVHRYWARKYGIRQKDVAGHEHIRDAARRGGILTRAGEVPAKKHDPGPHFPWARVLEVVPI